MPRPEVDAAASRIALLPAEVADGIAAGEVIDRPAAVVKELVENSIDAGATRIDIRLEAAGRQLIEVVDDGQGMSSADLRLAFHRHATSKLRSLDDLSALQTLGFRGEALASIAAVSRVEAASRRRDGGEGFRVVIEGGITIVARTAGSPVGTRISVSRLFFNTPARLKFLRQPATEAAAMARLAAELALANPAIGFSLDVDGRRVLETPGNSDLRAAFAAIYDLETADAMLAIDEPSVHGLLSPPALHRGTRDHIVLLVNGRRIHHRNLVFAIEQSYRGLREPDRFPLAVLNLLIDPADVDVNVHPTKREVRFRNEGATFAMLERSCYRALRGSPIYELQAPTSGPVLELRETAVISGPHPALQTPQPLAPHVARGSPGPAGPQRGREIDAASAGPRLPPLSYIGQLLRGYLVAEATDAVVFVDQHAAHERVLFDRLLRRLQEHRPASQQSLVPHLLDLTAPQLAAFRQHAAWLQTIGFEAEAFGPHTIRVLATPSDMPEGRADRVLELLLADLAGERTPDRRLRETAALIACHSAVRFGDRLEATAARELLSSLNATDEPISCPHGRPTTLVLADEDLRRLFKRP